MVSSLLITPPAFLMTWRLLPEPQDPVDAEAGIHAGEHGDPLRGRQ
jgi:hypothetical protein